MDEPDFNRILLAILDRLTAIEARLPPPPKGKRGPKPIPKGTK